MIRARSFEEIVRSMIGYLRTTEMGRNVDVKIGTATRDVMLDPQGWEMSMLSHAVRDVQKSQSVVFAEDMSEDELDNLVADWFLKRKQGDKATGQVTFYVSYQPQETFIIPGGTIVTKPANAGNPPVKFVTTTSVTLNQKATYSQSSTSPDAVDGYFDVDLAAYAVVADIEAMDSGSTGNVGPGEINMLETALAGGLQVTNKVKTQDGTNQEINKDLGARQRQALTGVSVGTKDGYEARIKQNVSEVLEVLTVGPHETMMLRDGGYGGKLDFYVMARPFKTLEREEIIKKVWSTDNPFGADIILGYQPVSSIVQVELLKNGVSIPTEQGGPIFLKPAQLLNSDMTAAEFGDYALIKDTSGIFSGSIYANDVIRFYSSLALGADESLGIIYNINLTVLRCQNYLELERVTTDDVLAKEAKERRFKIGMTIDVYNGFDTLDVKSNVNSMVVDAFKNTTMKALIQQSDIVAIARQDEGIDNLLIPLDKMMFVEDEITPMEDEQIELRDETNSDIVLNYQPVVKVEYVYNVDEKGNIVGAQLKQEGDVVFVENENIIMNLGNENIRNTIVGTSGTIVDNQAVTFYLSKGRLRSSEGKEVVPADIAVEGTLADIIEVEPEVSILNTDGNSIIVSRITFNVPPTSDELIAGVRVNYYYDDGRTPDYSLVKDTSSNGYTFNAQDKITWLRPFETSKGKHFVKIIYYYTKLNRGDIQLEVNEFATVKSSDIDIKIRNIVPLPSNKIIPGQRSPEAELNDI